MKLTEKIFLTLCKGKCDCTFALVLLFLAFDSQWDLQSFQFSLTILRAISDTLNAETPYFGHRGDGMRR